MGFALYVLLFRIIGVTPGRTPRWTAFIYGVVTPFSRHGDLFRALNDGNLGAQMVNRWLACSSFCGRAHFNITGSAAFRYRGTSVRRRWTAHAAPLCTFCLAVRVGCFCGDALAAVCSWVGHSAAYYGHPTGCVLRTVWFFMSSACVGNNYRARAYRRRRVQYQPLLPPLPLKHASRRTCAFHGAGGIGACVHSPSGMHEQRTTTATA